mmetsp:Transcript_30609/g.27096  ORF Transcript_30609/g.27096 Transcript_30609/m.27096 type:complete len:216 (+) Transcript_30609:136-783(+)
MILNKKHEDKHKFSTPNLRVKPLKKTGKLNQNIIYQKIKRDASKNKLVNPKIGKRSYDSDQYDRLNPTSGSSKRGLLSKAGNSVISRKDRKLLEEEAKLVNQYYKHYKNPKPIRDLKAKNIKYDQHHNPHPKAPSYHKEYENPPPADAEELEEEERVSLIATLEKKKREISLQIQRLPVCNRSIIVVQKEKDLYRELDEVSSDCMLLYNDRIFIA